MLKHLTDRVGVVPHTTPGRHR